MKKQETTNSKIDEISPTKLAELNKPTPEQKKRWDKMARGFVNNLNKNVKEES